MQLADSKNALLQLMGQVNSNPNVPELQVMRKQVSRIVQRCANKRYAPLLVKAVWDLLPAELCLSPHHLSAGVHRLPRGASLMHTRAHFRALARGDKYRRLLLGTLCTQCMQALLYKLVCWPSLDTAATGPPPWVSYTGQHV